MDDYHYQDGAVYFRTVNKQGMNKNKRVTEISLDRSDWVPLKNAFQRNEDQVMGALAECGSCQEAFDLLSKRR